MSRIDSSPAWRGENHPLHKLTEENVRYIRRSVANHERSQAELARRFGVDPSTIRQVVVGETWKRVTLTVKGSTS